MASISDARAIAAGSHACAVLGDGTVWCWGANQFGQLGDGSTTDRTAPVPVAGLTGAASAVAAGSGHSCARLTDGTVQCWGSNRFGQAGANPGWLPAWPVPGL